MADLNSEVAPSAVANKPADARMRRIAFILLAIVVVPPLLFAGFLAAVDPYYLFGSPSIRGFNLVRPYYEPYVVVAKPYQVSRLKPSTVIIGSSNTEVGIDPQHPGWKSSDVFNFALPASNSYVEMLTFLHAQRVARIKHAVVNVDFFSYNINFPIVANLFPERLAPGITTDFAAYLAQQLAQRSKRENAAGPAKDASPAQPDWDEQLYLAANADVAAAIARKEFKSGREHWELAGKAEHRLGSSVPADWNEAGYLLVNPDVAAAVERRIFLSGYHHFLAAGRVEGRLGGLTPATWDDNVYLATHPDARIRVALGHYWTGYQYYAAVGRLSEPVGTRLLGERWPRLSRSLFFLGERLHMMLSGMAIRHAVSTVLRQSEPADFNDLGMRVWQGREAFVRQSGGTGKVFRDKLVEGGNPWLVPPIFQYCVTNDASGMTSFDPYRFMLRSAYAGGVEVQLLTTPTSVAVQQFFRAVGLYDRYQYWLRELVRINEEEAKRAGREPFPIWDFGDVNSITSEPIPASGDLAPMKWYWEHGHYRKTAGDLMLDRIFDDKGARTVPPDFGVRLTSRNIGDHLARASAALSQWASDNPELVELSREPKSKAGQAKATCW